MENGYTEREQVMPKKAGRRNWENKVNTKEQLCGVSIRLVCLDRITNRFILNKKVTIK